MMLIVKCPGREKTFKFLNVPFMSQRGEICSLLINEQVSENEAVEMAKVTALCQVLHTSLHILFPVLVTMLTHWAFHLLGSIWKGRHRELAFPVYTDVGWQGWSAQIQSPGFPLRTGGTGQNPITHSPGYCCPSHLIREGRPHALGTHVFTRWYFKGVWWHLHSSPMKVMFAAVF